KTPRTGRYDQPRPSLRRDGRRCAGAVSGLADEDRAGAGRGVLPGQVALIGGANFLLFLAAALVIAAVPGPGIFYVAARTLSGGKQAGVASTFGTALGGLVHVIAGGVGVSAIILASAELFTLLKLLGAIYLVWLGIRTFREAGVMP